MLAGCFPEICEPWPRPELCCNDVCVTDEDELLLEYWWDAVTQWLYDATCQQFPGCCPVEVEPCPPCGCNSACGCGPWATIDLSEAFCHPVCVTDGVPCLEFAFPDGETIGPEDGVWQLLPDRYTVDWCEPPGYCGGWPSNDCKDPWTIRAVVGCPPPKLLLEGASRFVCELIKECKGQDNCLPDGVKSITRRGITVDVSPGFEETINFETKGTGIPILDIALRDYGCPKTVVKHIDPLAKYDQQAGLTWSYRPRLNPTPPSCG